MRSATTILAYVIAFVGLLMIVPGVWGFFILVTATTPQVPLRYYAIDFGIISGGLGMIRR
jgi:hypothetical protein